MRNNRQANRRSKTVAALSVAALGLGLSLTGCVPGFPGGGMSRGSDDGSRIGSPNSETANSVDTMFTMMMIPHHAQAIEMVDVLLAKDGVDPEVLALAERVKAAQVPEIELMESWLSAWGMPSPSGMGGTDGMEGMDHGGDGMMSEADMQALENASGSGAGTIFLNQMISHHEGAIAMTQPVISGGADPDVIALAEGIVTSQTAEIAEMRALLLTL